MRSDRHDRPSPGSLRRRLERLDRLPLRPATVRRLVTEALENGTARLGAEPPREVELDPGYALRQSRSGTTSGRVLRLVERATWWGDSPWDCERERLWRHSVASSLAAGRFAIEAGRSDAAEVRRLGLLADLGWWALAATEPALLAELLRMADPADRRALLATRLGVEVATIGRDLAERWGLGADAIDAAWLASLPEGTLVGCAGDGTRLALLQKAHALAERTPWRLGPIEPDEPTLAGPVEPDEALRRWLVAEVQSRCPGPLVEPVAESGSLSRTACRRAARLLGRERRARRDRERAARRLDAVVEEHRRAASRTASEARRERLDALAEFAAGAGHELNNPLAVVQGRAQLLIGRTSDPEAIRSLRAIIAQTQRAHRLIRDLMYVARPPAPRCRPCLPFELARACLRDLQADAESRGVGLRFDAEGVGPRVWTDPEALRHLIEVLSRNAVEATGPGGQVVVNVQASAGDLVWQFRDPGRGLDGESASHLFDPFYCGRQAGRGLGLGLPRVGRYLGQLGGRIRWQAGASGGSVFTVVLPLATAPDETAGPTP